MKRIALLIAVSFGLTLTGCTTPGAAPVAEISARIEIESVRALNVTEILYQAAARLVLAAVAIGKISGADAEAARIMNQQALDALSAAKSAITVEDRLNATRDLSDITAGLRSMAILAAPELVK